MTNITKDANDQDRYWLERAMEPTTTPLTRLTAIRRLRKDLDALALEAVDQARHGYTEHTWTEIADALDVTRQAAQQRYGSELH